MVRHIVVLSSALICIAFSASAEEHRQLGAHIHGHGRLNIAIEDKTMSIELEVPAADIVGFEHEPETPEQKAVLEDAKAKLAAGLSLFTPAPAAGCVQKMAGVKAEAEHEDAEHEEEHEAHDAGHQHSEFHAEYAFECPSPSQLTSMTFDYFKVFPKAEELDTSLISPKGQASFEVKRDKPSLDLSGMM